VRTHFCFGMLLIASFALAQQTAPTPSDQQQTTTQDTNKTAPVSKQQPKRILGIMPNYKAVSAGTHPPPPTARQSFITATKNTFDYSNFLLVGVTSALAEGTDAHPPLGKGMPGFARYYWRGFVDKADGNYMTTFVLPTLLQQDARYYAKGQGSTGFRLKYAATRVFITPNYDGKNEFNASEVFGIATAQAISLAYYPAESRTGGKFAKKYAFALGRDALTNVLREFWPDIATKVFHKKQ
jgi:hypothetical protein